LLKEIAKPQAYKIPIKKKKNIRPKKRE